MEQDVKKRAAEACSLGEDFAKHYYEAVDKKRHLVSRHYLDTAVLVWNGNGTVGKDNIQKFFEELPISEHTLTSLDSQPVLDSAVAKQETYLIQVSGNVKFQAKAPKPFQQCFMITAEGGKWKIVSDCFRLQEPVF